MKAVFESWQRKIAHNRTGVMPAVVRATGACVFALSATLLPVTPLRADDTPAAPTTQAAPVPAQSDAAKLLDQAASDQAKLKQEVAIEVEAHYQTGKRLYENFEYEGAKRELELAYRLDGSNEKVRTLLIQVKDKFGERLSRIRSAMSDVAVYKAVETQARLIELDNRIDRARRAMKEAGVEGAAAGASALSPAERVVKYENALVELERAREIIKYLPYEVKTGEHRNEVDRLAADADKAVHGIRASLDAGSRDQAMQASKATMELQRKADTRKLNMAIDRARVSFELGQYQQALKQAQVVLDLDPLNADAHSIIVQSRDRFHTKREENIREEYEEQFKLNKERADRTNIPHSDYLIYPENWREIAQRTSQEARRRPEEPWKDEVRKKMKRLVSFEFVDTPLEDALKFLDSLTRVNIILDPKAVADGANKTPINLRVQDMELELALKWILKLAELEFDLKNQAVYITKKADVTTSIELEIYDIRDLTTTITDFPGPRIDVGTAGAGTDVSNPFGGPPPTAGLQASDIATLIKEKIMAAEFAADPAFSIEESNGKLVVMQRPEVHERIRQLLRSFRETQTIQVLTQVRFVDVTDNFLETIGIHFTGLDAAPNERGLLNAAVDPLKQPSASGLFPAGGGPGLNPPLPSDIQPSPAYQFQNFQTTPPFVNQQPGPRPILLLHPRLDANFPNDGGNTVVGPAGAPVGFRRQWYSNALGSPTLIQALTQNFTRSNPLGSVLGQSVQTSPQQGALFQFRFLQSIQTSAVLQALRKDQTSDELLAPKLMQYNNQRAHVLVAQQRSYIKDYDVSGAVYDPVISSFLTGVVLEVRPTVSNDKKYITLELRPGTAIELTAPLIIYITNGGNTAIPGGNINLQIELPNLELRSINTTVTIPDNGTMLFSGLINDRKIDAKSGIPLLSDLPIVGRFFSTNNKERVRRNLLVLVNSRIILFDEEEANIAERSAPLPRYPKPVEPKAMKCKPCEVR